jgi:hypothetical protein
MEEGERGRRGRGFRFRESVCGEGRERVCGEGRESVCGEGRDSSGGETVGAPARLPEGPWRVPEGRGAGLALPTTKELSRVHVAQAYVLQFRSRK